MIALRVKNQNAGQLRVPLIRAIGVTTAANYQDIADTMPLAIPNTAGDVREL